MFKSNIIIIEILVQTEAFQSGPMAATHRKSPTRACVSVGSGRPENTSRTEPLRSAPVNTHQQSVIQSKQFQKLGSEVDPWEQL